MQIIEAPQVHQLFSHAGYRPLVDALQLGFSQDFGMPPRQVFPLAPESNKQDAFAVLPAWNEKLISVKAFTYFPQNPSQGFASLYSKLMVFERAHGQPLALIDGTSLTLWRTAAVSALAARLLARADAQSLLLLGTGNLAQPLIEAHLALRPLRHIMLWGRRGAHDHKALDLQKRLQTRYPELTIEVVAEIAPSAALADIIVAATASPQPLLAGSWIAPGCHVDLLGNHSPEQRECDSALVQAASVFVDSRANVLREAGEILLPIKEGVFSADDIRAELAELCSAMPESSQLGSARNSTQQITLFKSVGTALADLLAAQFLLSALKLI